MASASEVLQSEALGVVGVALDMAIHDIGKKDKYVNSLVSNSSHTEWIQLHAA